jgi:UDP-N-acetyl-D-mannosaminuronic acid dehydrogenase
VHLVHAPERIIPGNMIYELEYNSRTVGADDPQIGERVKELYSSFCKSEIVVQTLDQQKCLKLLKTHIEMSIYAFANELAKICRTDNMDVYEIIRIANKHPRVNILSRGLV